MCNACGRGGGAAPSNARAWADAADPDLCDLLRYLREDSAGGELSREIDSLVDEYNSDRKWVSRVMMLEEDIAMRCRRERAEGREEGAGEMAALMARLLKEGRVEEAARAAEDVAFRERMLSKERA